MKKFLNVIGIFFSIVISVILFLLEMLLITNIVLNIFFQDGTLSVVIERLISKNYQEEKVLLTYADSRTYGSINKNKIDFNSIEGKIKEYLKNNGFTEKEASDIVRDEEFKSVVNNYLESVVLSEIKNAEIRYPTKEEVKSFVKKNYNSLSKIKAISEKYNEETIDEFVEENYDEVKDKLEEITEEVKVPEIKEIEYLKKIVNINPFLILAAIIFSFILLMLFRLSFYKWLLWGSIPIFIGGILISAFGLFGIKLITTLAIFDDYTEVIDPIAKKMSTLMIKSGIIAIIITIVMLTIYLIVKNKVKKGKKAK